MILGAPPFEAVIRQQHGGGPHPEETIRKQHIQIVTGIPCKADYFCAHYQRIGARVRLQEVVGEIDSGDAGGAAHAAEVVALDIVPEFVAVDDHGREGGGGVEHPTVDDQDPQVLGADAGGGDELVHRPEHGGPRLLPPHRQVLRVARPEHHPWQVRLVAYAGGFQDSLLEFDRLLVELPRFLG